MQKGDMLKAIDVLELKKVSYSYGVRKQCIKKASFLFERGKIYAITGESGIGKNTLLDIIASFSGGYGGEIKVNETDKNRFNIKGYREEIAYIEQNSRFSKIPYDIGWRNQFRIYQKNL